jgi:hypothetical protein
MLSVVGILLMPFPTPGLADQAKIPAEPDPPAFSAVPEGEDPQDYWRNVNDDPDAPITTLPWQPGNDTRSWEEILRECDPGECLDYADLLEQGVPPWLLPPPDSNAPAGPGGPWTPPTKCEPRDPSRPRPNITAMAEPLSLGTITHAAGEGDVVTGMETKFSWDGPAQVTWIQPAVPGVTEDCTLVPGQPVEFTAQLETVIFEFEEGERTQYVTETGSVNHRYESTGEFTVCVYAGYVIPGEGFAGLIQAADLDHRVVEVRSTLVE